LRNVAASAAPTLIELTQHVSQVFLSYRHVPRDEELAEGLCAYLRERGLRVFLDKQIRIGLDWVAEIDRQLRASDAFVVLLSEDSIRSSAIWMPARLAAKRKSTLGRPQSSAALPDEIWPCSKSRKATTNFVWRTNSSSDCPVASRPPSGRSMWMVPINRSSNRDMTRQMTDSAGRLKRVCVCLVIQEILGDLPD
jgi:hypothetical protein